MDVHKTPTGFVTAIDPRWARRQLHMSAGVLLVLALGIAAIVFAVRPQRAIAIEAAPPSETVVLTERQSPARPVSPTATFGN